MVAEVPNAVDHMSAVGSFGSIHAVEPPADIVRPFADVVLAVVGTTHRSLEMILGKRGQKVGHHRRTLEDSDEVERLVARYPPPIGPRHCLLDRGSIQRILLLACGCPPVHGWIGGTQNGLSSGPWGRVARSVKKRQFIK